MNASRTEDDLRAALVELSQDAPTPADVVPDDALTTRPARRAVRWLAPAVAAAVAAAIAVAVVVFGRSPTSPAARGDDLSALVGVQWQLHTIDGTAVPAGSPLKIEPNGRFFQAVAPCSTVDGHVAMTSTSLDVQRVELSPGLCPGPLDESSQQQRRNAATTHAVQLTFRGTISWRIVDGRLILARRGAPALSYTRDPRSPEHTRQWTFRAVGITLPRSWPANAMRCTTPIMNTVIFPGPVDQCLAPRPAGTTAVEFAVYRPGHTALSSVPPSGTLVDGIPVRERIGSPTSGTYRGLQVVEIQIPSRKVTITITSPNRLQVARLAGEVYLVGQ